MKKLIVSSIIASIMLPATTFANNKQLNQGEVAYHNTFPISQSEAYDIFITNTDYANTVIMSNTIAGVMYGYLIKQKYPKMKFNKDYLYGSLIGQLMQESDMSSQLAQNFNPNDPDQLIHNSTYANILLQAGQGGPYQINDYSKRLPSAEAKGALGLVNYNAVAAILGYSIQDQDDGSQTKKIGPEALDNIYSGPMITAFYHFNDINRMNVNSTNDWYVYHDQWNKCLENSQKNTAGGLTFPFVMNVVYNAGDYSPVLKTYLNICAEGSTNTKEYKNINNWLLETINYQTIIGAEKPNTGEATYYRYPRQVSFYINQIFNSNNKKLEDTGITVNNQVTFSISRLKQVFAMVMHKLSYRDNNDDLHFISIEDANKAFDQAINQITTTDGQIPEALSFSNTQKTTNQQRLLIYKIIQKAISNLAQNNDIDFTKTYDESKPSPEPGPTPEPQYTYPDGIGSYVNGTVVKAGDSQYKCKVANWCNNPAYTPLGNFSDAAWENLNPQPKPTPVGTWDPTKEYVAGDTVEINGVKYAAQWWNKGVNPVENHTQYQDPWNIVK
ncbi:carbohydrate binding domain protein [Francisella sp. TX07-6608]|nr:carbohydrate binding domain protein [Francisella sp. TX07-6608]